MATLPLYQVSARGLAYEPDSRGGTGWPGKQNDGDSLPTVLTLDSSALRASVFGRFESTLPHQLLVLKT